MAVEAGEIGENRGRVTTPRAVHRVPRLLPPRMIDALYTTTDPHLAAFLASENARFVGLERTGPKSVRFSFIADRELHVLLRLYWGGRPIPTVPSRLLETLHTLRCLSIVRF